MSKKENYKYFNEFISMADNIVDSANILNEIIENYDVENLEANIQRVHILENQADDTVHRMRNYLIKDFLPPIDREDIAEIVNKLDDIEDGIDEALINIKIFNIEKMKSEVLELVNVLLKCSVAVKDIFINLNNFKNIELIKQKTGQVNNLEEEGDRIYEKLMTSLYKNEKDPITLIKWTNMYNCIEETIDKCEEIGDCVEDVIMKNS